MEIEVNISLMIEEDLGQVIEIENDSFTTPWTKEGFLDAINNKYYRFITAKTKDGEVCGYCGFYQSALEAYITNVAVAKKFRQKKIAQKMLQRLIQIGNLSGVKDFTLEVRISNKAALNLYEKFGFRSEGIRKNFYHNPTEDAYVMWLYGN